MEISGANPIKKGHDSSIIQDDIKHVKVGHAQNHPDLDNMTYFLPKELRDMSWQRLSQWKEAPDIRDEYNAFKVRYQTLRELPNIYDTDIDPTLISPNKLHYRFSQPVRLVETKLCQEVAETIDNAKDNVTFKGPIGIGKSHALLAKMIKLRQLGHIVFYVNYPQEWIHNELLYFINELIYAFVPLADIIHVPQYLEPPVGEKVDNLLIWFTALRYCIDLGQEPLHDAIKVFQTKFKDKTKHMITYALLDQENAFVESNMNTKPVGKDFPFMLRYNFCSRTVISYSANNTLTSSQSEQTSLECFMQMTWEQIGKIAIRFESEQKKFSEGDIKALFEASGGNPLEAHEFLRFWEKEKEKTAKVFQQWIQDQFGTRVKEITKKHHQEFMNNRTKEFKKDFEVILPYVDANARMDLSHPLFPKIDEIINQQYIYLEEKTKFLKTLTPVAAHVFQAMKGLTEIEGALRIILFETAKITADTIGRLLEFYIISQLKKKDSQSINLKYNTTEVKDKQFILSYAEVIVISGLYSLPDSKPKYSALFIPDSPNYPYVDLIYYDKEEKTLYPIQVTVNLVAHKDSHAQFTQKKFGEWKTFLGVADLNLKFIWVGGGWNPQKLKLQNSSGFSKTPGSWYISYKQFPITNFPLFRDLHQGNFFVDTVLKIDKIPIPGLTNKWSDEALKTNFIKWLKEFVKSQRNTIKIYFFYESSPNCEPGQNRGAFLEFRDLEDRNEFKSKFTSTTSDLDSEEIQAMDQYEEEGWKVVTVRPGMEIE